MRKIVNERSSKIALLCISGIDNIMVRTVLQLYSTVRSTSCTAGLLGSVKFIVLVKSRHDGPGLETPQSVGILINHRKMRKREEN